MNHLFLSYFYKEAKTKKGLARYECSADHRCEYRKIANPTLVKHFYSEEDKTMNEIRVIDFVTIHLKFSFG